MCIAEEGIAPIYGINYKDSQTKAANWLAEWGKPYVAIGADDKGRATIDWGAYGVPETYIIDQAGVIRYRHVGPLFPEILEETIVPLIRSLREK